MKHNLNYKILFLLLLPAFSLGNVFDRLEDCQYTCSEDCRYFILRLETSLERVKDNCSDFLNNPDVVQACNSLSSNYIEACLNGNQNSVESIRTCNSLSSEYIIPCLSGGRKTPEAIKACNSLSSKYIKACLLR